MSYLIINLTNYGQGYRQVGVVRSHKRAWAIADKLNDYLAKQREQGEDKGDGFTVINLNNIDRVKDDYIHDWATEHAC